MDNKNPEPYLSGGHNPVPPDGIHRVIAELHLKRLVRLIDVARTASNPLELYTSLFNIMTYIFNDLRHEPVIKFIWDNDDLYVALDRIHNFVTFLEKHHKGVTLIRVMFIHTDRTRHYLDIFNNTCIINRGRLGYVN